VIFAIYGWMIVSDIIFVGQPIIVPGMSKIASMAGMIVFLFGIEWYSQVQASQYLYIKAIIRSEFSLNKIVHLFINREAIAKDVPDPTQAGWKVTELPLGVKVKLDRYGEDIIKVRFQHLGLFYERIIPTKCKCNYKGNIVDHSGGATVTLYDYAKGGVDMDHNVPIPSFVLKEAPGDFATQPLPTLVVGAQSQRVKVLLNWIKRAQPYIVRLEAALRKTGTSKSWWHTHAIHGEGKSRSTQEELDGVLKDRRHFDKAVAEYCQSRAKSIEDIRQLTKGGGFLSRLPKWIVYPIILGMVLVFIVAQPNMQQGFGEWISTGNNQWFVLGFSALVAIILYYLYRRKTSK